MASSSSIKIIAGAFSLARANASLTILAPSPINIYKVKSGALSLVHTSIYIPALVVGQLASEMWTAVKDNKCVEREQVVTLVWAAQALARSVFPVPGGPYKSTPAHNSNCVHQQQRDTQEPFGGEIPMASNLSL